MKSPDILFIIRSKEKCNAFPPILSVIFLDSCIDFCYTIVVVRFLKEKNNYRAHIKHFSTGMKSGVPKSQKKI